MSKGPGSWMARNLQQIDYHLSQNISTAAVISKENLYRLVECEKSELG